jgi:predicted RNase H-like HicB family nuclease
MLIRIEIRGQAGGEYQAICPDIGISCQGRSLEAVLERITDLLVFYFSTVDDSDLSAAEQNEHSKQLSVYLKGKNLFFPRDPKVH